MTHHHHHHQMMIWRSRGMTETITIISIRSICCTVKMMLMVVMMMITVMAMTMVILGNAYDRLIFARGDKQTDCFRCSHQTPMLSSNSDVLIKLIKLRCSHQTPMFSLNSDVLIKLQNDEMRRKTSVALLLNVRVARLNDTSAAGR